MTTPISFPLLTLDNKGGNSLQDVGTHGGVFVTGNPLSLQQQKFCSCVLGATNANNPYAVCAKTTHTSYRNCSDYYDFHNMPMKKLEGYYLLHNIPFPVNRDRQALIDGIKQWKLSTGHLLGSNLSSSSSTSSSSTTDENSCGCGVPVTGLTSKTSTVIKPLPTPAVLPMAPLSAATNRLPSPTNRSGNIYGPISHTSSNKGSIISPGSVQPNGVEQTRPGRGYIRPLSPRKINSGTVTVLPSTRLISPTRTTQTSQLKFGPIVTTHTYF